MLPGGMHYKLRYLLLFFWPDWKKHVVPVTKKNYDWNKDEMNEWIDQSNLQLNKTLHVHTYVYVQLYIFTYTYRYSYSENMFCVQHCIEKSLILLLLEHSATFWLCTHRWSLANSLHMFFAHDKDIFSRRKKIFVLCLWEKKVWIARLFG